MIVQSASPGKPHFVITMNDHTALAGAFARAFGNSEVEPVEPAEIMYFLVENHDRGWDAWDQAPALDPLTRLPYSLMRTPLDALLKTNAGSPDFCGLHHPYCGLLSSMHTTGLYNGRFGLSHHIALDHLAETARAPVQAMLTAESARRRQLKARLLANPVTARWLEEAHLMQNYKQLQFFDTLALYFNLNHAGERQIAQFPHVPRTAHHDIEIEITPTVEGHYRLSPWPFAGDRFEVSFHGRYLRPLARGDDATDAATALNEAAEAEQILRLIPGLIPG